MTNKANVDSIISRILPEIINIRRDIHKHPEVGFDVVRTAGIAANSLEKLGIHVKTGIGKTGVIGDLIVPGAKRTIALRADMDALPMQELRESDFKSVIDGKAHTCGHDCHTAMLIGAAMILSELKDQLNANVRFIFQPNEEALPGGAPAMITDGALENVDEIYGLHVWPLLPTGSFGVCEGPALGQPDIFSIEITGIGGHAAVPHRTIDPLLIGAQLVTVLQSIVSRNVDPLESAVLSVTQFNAGSADNVIAQSAKIIGTVRTFKKDVQKLIRARIEETATSLAIAHNAGAVVTYREGYPVTFNHKKPTAFARKLMESIVGKEKVDYPAVPVLGGEDFAYYTEKVPGTFVFLGIRNEAKDTIYMCHDPRFGVDEDAFREGMMLHSLLALNFS